MNANANPLNPFFNANNFVESERSLVPTKYLLIKNMFTEEEMNSEATFLRDLHDDLYELCSKFGEIVNIPINSSKKIIMIEFKTAE